MRKILTLIPLCLLLWLSIFFPGCDFSPNSMYQLTFKDDIQARHPVWSPSGDTIVFSGVDFNEDVRGLWTIDPQGGNLSLILNSSEVGTEYTWLFAYDYSDDGYLLFSDDGSIFAGNIYYLPPDGGDPTYIFQGAHPTIKGNLDGVYNIAYYYEPPFKGPNGIYLTDIHGSEPKLVVEDDFIYGPHWSPDGEKLVYVQNMRSTSDWTCKIFVYDIVNEKEELIYENHYRDIDSARWSPNGQWIAFTMPCESTSKGEVYIVPADGGEPTRLTEFPYGPSYPCPGAGSLFWSPDGKWIVYDLITRELWKVSVE